MNSRRSNRLRQIIYIVTPLAFLLLVLAGINGWGRWQNAGIAVSPPDGTTTAVTTPAPSTTLAITPPATPLPTPTAIPTATPYIPPTFPPEAQITLLGPPANSTFNTADTAVFYWQWSLPLSEDQFFTLYAQTDADMQPVDSLAEPNFGDSYRLTIQLSQLPPNTTAWQIRLQTKESDQPLFTSDSRPLNILP